MAAQLMHKRNGQFDERSYRWCMDFLPHSDASRIAKHHEHNLSVDIDTLRRPPSVTDTSAGAALACLTEIADRQYLTNQRAVISGGVDADGNVQFADLSGKLDSPLWKELTTQVDHFVASKRSIDQWTEHAAESAKVSDKLRAVTDLDDAMQFLCQQNRDLPQVARILKVVAAVFIIGFIFICLKKYQEATPHSSEVAQRFPSDRFTENHEPDGDSVAPETPEIAQPTILTNCKKYFCVSESLTPGDKFYFSPQVECTLNEISVRIASIEFIRFDVAGHITRSAGSIENVQDAILSVSCPSIDREYADVEVVIEKNDQPLSDTFRFKVNR